MRYNGQQLKKTYAESSGCRPAPEIHDDFRFPGAVIGAIIAQYIDVSILKITFGLICIISTVALVLVKSPDSLENIRTEGYLFNLFAFLAALFNGLVGPAGAAFLIPIFVAYLKYPIKNTIGTTSLLSVATALGGVICYIILGLKVQELPDFPLGYVNLLQFVFLTVTSIIVAGYAANLAQRISVKN